VRIAVLGWGSMKDKKKVTFWILYFEYEYSVCVALLSLINVTLHLCVSVSQLCLKLHILI